MPPEPSPLVPIISGLLLFAPCLAAQELKHAALDSPFGTFGDTGLPFLSQTLDARGLPSLSLPDNLTPRGIILHLGDGIHACFDPDLLRLACVWREKAPGDYLLMNGMAPGSYRKPNRKAPAGQRKLPAPIGTPLLSSGLYPGIQLGTEVSLNDPREPSVDEAEVGRGPLPATLGEWIGLRLDQEGPTLVYQVGDARIEERITASSDKEVTTITRTFWLAPHRDTLAVLATRTSHPAIQPSMWPHEFLVSYIFKKEGRPDLRYEPRRDPRRTSTPPDRFWPEKVLTGAGVSSNRSPFDIEDLPLPVQNPWKRNVRPSDFDFFPDGRLALVTFDGDVWIADGIARREGPVTWTRFAGGLNEPMGLRIVKGNIVVFDRNGLLRLRDEDGNGEADFYECLSSLPAQTAETREFAMSLEAKPGGGFYLAKGGQTATTRGKFNGTLLEVSPDGRKVKVVATGLRQPFTGLDPQTGLLTASDQQGHWKPATPIHVVKPGDYYGFQPVMLGPEANKSKSITEPPIWIPHFVNQSGARQLWLRNAKMGALNDSLLHLGYNRPALFKVFLEVDKAQGAVVPLLDGFPTGLLGGRVNPQDGLLYVGGLNIWGTVGKKIQGLYRIRPTGEPSWIPREVRAFQEGVLLSFDQALDREAATTLANYTLDRWNYLRSHNYGSGHYMLNGEPGQEPLPLSSVCLSEDHRSVFLGIPDMSPVHTLRVTYRHAPERVQNAYLTVHRLRPVDLTALGFEETVVNLTLRSTPGGPSQPEPSAAEGRKVAELYGCIACHSTDGSKKVAEEPDLVVGPTWKNLYGSQRTFTDGTVMKKADEFYLRESILDPARYVTKGFETKDTGVGMPSYLGVLRNDQIDSLILYIKSLAGK